jgi:hypothetical protein
VSRAIAERCDKNACVLPIKIGFRVAESALGRPRPANNLASARKSTRHTDEREMRVHVCVPNHKVWAKNALARDLSALAAISHGPRHVMSNKHEIKRVNA